MQAGRPLFGAIPPLELKWALRRWAWPSWLEQKFQPKLNQPGITGGAGCPAEECAGKRGIGSPEIRVVKSVEELRPELETVTLHEARVLGQGKVPVL